MTPVVVIVDDNLDFLNVLTFELQDRYRFLKFSNPINALSEIEQGLDFDLIISDFRMDEMSGVDLLERISTISPDKPRLLMTGWCDDDDLRRHVDSGLVVSILHKFIDIDELTSKLDLAYASIDCVRPYENK